MVYAPPQYIFVLSLPRADNSSVPPLPQFCPPEAHFGVAKVRNRHVKQLFGFTVLQESSNGMVALLSL